MTTATLQVLLSKSLNPDTQTDVLDEAMHALKVEQYLQKVYTGFYSANEAVMDS